MTIPVRMPSFGLTEGVALITHWIRQEGEAVSVGDILFVAENEKAVLEVPAPADGILLRILVSDGQVSPLKSEVALIGKSGESIEVTSVTTEVGAALPVEQAATSIPVERRQKVSPVARNFARANRLDLTKVQGTGPGGRIKLADVEAYVAVGGMQDTSVGQTGLRADGAARNSLRLQIARRLSESARETVPVPLWVDVDLSEAERLRERTRTYYVSQLGASLSLNTLLAWATACMLRENSELNAWWAASGPQPQSQINLAFAVDTPDGLLAPVIHGVDHLSLLDLQRQISGIVERARTRRCSPEELRGSTFTLTNLGRQGISTFIPILNPPEVGILAVGQATPRVIPVDGQAQVRPLMTLCLVFDHRALDGTPAARGLARLKALLENPYLLL